MLLVISTEYSVVVSENMICYLLCYLLCLAPSMSFQNRYFVSSATYYVCTAQHMPHVGHMDFVCDWRGEVSFVALAQLCREDITHDAYL